MNDKIGRLPKIKNKEQALQEILHVASDKRKHILLNDCNDWLKLKMKVIKRLAKKGLKMEAQNE